MPSLLQIGSELQAFLDLVDEAAGELTPETERALDAWFGEINQQFEQKADGYCALIREVELRAAARREEAERLLKHVNADDNLAKRLKLRLKEYMEHFQIKKVVTPRFSVAVQANGGHQAVDVQIPAKELPTQYQRVRIEADTEAIREDLKAGKQVDGCTLMERGTHLRIR